MTVSITIENLDADIIERLRDEARRRGVDVSVLAGKLIEESLPPATEESPPPYHDLDHLAGTWSKEDATAFLAATADFEQVDEDLWK